MTRVVWHDRDYLVGPELWGEAKAFGSDPTCVIVCGSSAYTRRLIAAELSVVFGRGKVGGWEWTPHWTVTAFLESLSSFDRARGLTCLHEAAIFAIQVTGQYFEARHRDRGRPGPKANPTFALFGLAVARDGTPRYHLRAYLQPRVRQDRSKGTYDLRPADPRQLYELRDLFNATAGAKMAEQLRNVFGVRVGPVGRSREPALLDVPPELGEALNFHRQRATAYLAQHHLPNRPLARAWAAWATQGLPTGGPDPVKEYRAVLARHGFVGVSITRRTSPVTLNGDLNAGRQIHAFAAVRGEADRLAAERGSFVPADLVACSLKALSGEQTAEATLEAARRVLEAPRLFDLARIEPTGRRPLLTTANSRPVWRQVFFETAELSDPARGLRPNVAARPNTRLADLVGRVTGPRRFSVVVSPAAWAVVRAVSAAHKRAGLPVRRVQGAGTEWTRGTLARLVRDLSPCPVRTGRREALRAATRLHLSSPTTIVAYARAVYPVCSRPQDGLRKGTLVVVENFGAANPELLLALFHRARERGASVLLIDDQARNQQVLRAAWEVLPGRHVIVPPVTRPDLGQVR